MQQQEASTTGVVVALPGKKNSNGIPAAASSTSAKL